MPGLIIIMGLVLVFVNGQATGQMAAFWDIITNNQSASVTTAQQGNMALLLGEVAFIVILATLAGENQEFGYLGVTLMAALWIVWMVKNPTGITNLTNVLSGNPYGKSGG